MTKTNRFLLSIPLLFVASCTSTSEFGLALLPGTTAELQVSGDGPFVQVDNGGPAPIEVSFLCVCGELEQVRLKSGCVARTLLGGGLVRCVLRDGAGANVHVRVTGSSGVELHCQGTGP